MRTARGACVAMSANHGSYGLGAALAASVSEVPAIWGLQKLRPLFGSPGNLAGAQEGRREWIPTVAPI